MLLQPEFQPLYNSYIVPAYVNYDIGYFMSMCGWVGRIQNTYDEFVPCHTPVHKHVKLLDITNEHKLRFDICAFENIVALCGTVSMKHFQLVVKTTEAPQQQEQQKLHRLLQVQQHKKAIAKLQQIEHSYATQPQPQQQNNNDNIDNNNNNHSNNYSNC